MSHLTKLKVRLQDKVVLDRLLKEYGWTAQQVPEFVNAWDNQTVENATMIMDSNGATKLVLGQFGEVVVDAYDMGFEHQQFITDYSKEILRQQAVIMGGTFRDLGTDDYGNAVVELEV